MGLHGMMLKKCWQNGHKRLKLLGRLVQLRANSANRRCGTSRERPRVNGATTKPTGRKPVQQQCDQTSGDTRGILELRGTRTSSKCAQLKSELEASRRFDQTTQFVDGDLIHNVQASLVYIEAEKMLQIPERIGPIGPSRHRKKTAPKLAMYGFRVAGQRVGAPRVI
jgi:hypothetical protein